MMEFDLKVENLVRQDSKIMVIRGANVKVGYRLHADEFKNHVDPKGPDVTLFCLHLPQINQTYVDESEELVFEAMEEFFEEDLIRFYAAKLAAEKLEVEGGADDQ